MGREFLGRKGFMKTFKLITLNMLNQENDTMESIELFDGLIINREDDQNQWVIEAYMAKEYKEKFLSIQKEKKEIVVQVKISKETNEPATFKVKVVSVNKIGNNINVILIGSILNGRKRKAEVILEELISKGLEGKELLKNFKELMNKAESS
jgi:hypothetical protein